MNALRRSLAAVTLSLALAAPATARADTAEAAQAFKAGQVAYEAGEHVKAAESFERAYLAAPHGAAAYNAGVAWAVANKPARAASALERALDLKEDLSASEAADAQARLESLRNHLAVLTIKTAPGDAPLVDGEPPLVPKAYVEPGVHKVSVRHADGKTALERTVDVRRGAVVPVDLASAAGEGPAQAADDPEREKRETLRKTGAYALFGLSAVAFASTIVFGVRTLEARDQLAASANTDADARDRAIASKTLTNVSLFVTVAAAAGGAVLLFVLPKTSKQAGVYLAPTGAALRGTF